MVSARGGKTGLSRRTVNVFASAAHVAIKRRLADNTRSVLDKLSVMMRSSVEGTAFFGHTFLDKHVHSVLLDAETHLTASEIVSGVKTKVIGLVDASHSKVLPLRRDLPPPRLAFG